MKNSYLVVSWPDYHLIIQKLAATILTHSTKFDEIVSISRGGLTLGHILSDFLSLPVYSFAIQSYSDIQNQGELKITQELGKPISGKRILLVDDISDSGVTLKRAVEYLQKFQPAEITTVTLFLKPKSIFQPDYFAKRTNKWIIFPTEVAEPIKSITRKLESEGKSKAQIQEFLLSLGFRDDQIAFTRKRCLNI
jgi:uncharacterized protein